MPGRLFPLLLMLSLLSALIAGMDRDPVNAQARPNPPPTAAHYACPMHREVTSAKPGSCPKCRMALRPVEDKADAPASPARQGPAAPTDETPSISPSRLSAIRVYDQQGALKNFYTDLVKGRTVAINFIFTTCTTICPPLTATFRQVQQHLADRKLDVQLISISVDPTTDTSERLRAFAAKFKAGPGWTFVTGESAEIDALLQALGAAVTDKNDHTPMILIGNEVTGHWTRAYGLASPATLVKLITEAANHQ